MDSNLLSQLLFRAKKEDKCIQLMPSMDNHGFIIIDPKENWDIQSDTLVTDQGIIDLNKIVTAYLISYQRCYALTNHVKKIEEK